MGDKFMYIPNDNKQKESTNYKCTQCFMPQATYVPKTVGTSKINSPMSPPTLV